MGALLRLLTVAAFAILLYFVIDYVMGLVADKISLDDIAPTIKYYMCRLGIFDAVNIFVSFLVASWFANKLIVYMSGGL